MRNIAIIPARSGSKGLPNKNIIDLCGKPLMYYTIKAAIESKCFNEIMVSTDSEHYAEIARECGANVPFLRSKEMSSDQAGSWDAVREVLTNYAVLGETFDYVTLLQPTSPLRNAEDIKGIFKRLEEAQANNAVSITEVEHPIQWCFRLTGMGMMDEMAASPYSYMRRQELDTYFRENGAMYLVHAKKIMSREYNFYADKCTGYIMTGESSVDIDNALDLIVAQAYMKKISTSGE